MDRGVMEAAVNEVMRHFVESLRARDVEGAVSLFEQRAALFGSEIDETAQGLSELRSFFARLFARSQTYGWTWKEIVLAGDGHVIWFVAPATVVVQANDGGERTAPYRISGVLRQSVEGQWRFSLFNGAEPVPGDTA